MANARGHTRELGSEDAAEFAGERASHLARQGGGVRSDRAEKDDLVTARNEKSGKVLDFDGTQNLWVILDIDPFEVG